MSCDFIYRLQDQALKILGPIVPPKKITSSSSANSTEMKPQETLTLTYGARPRRQAAIAGAARILKVAQVLQGRGGSEHEGDLNEEDAEDTIVCSTSSTSVNKKVLIKKVTQLDLDNEEEEITGSAEEMDDDKDEDFEVNNEDSDEEDVGVEGDDDVSEVEGMLKERRFHGSRRKPRGDTRKQGKRPIGTNPDRNYLSVHSACLNVSKHGRKVSPKLKLWKERHLTNSV